MDGIEKKLDYRFNNIKYLNVALTHSSFANEDKSKKLSSNERLEFLGDSVLGLLCAEYLFSQYKSLPEGELTKMRSAVVCEQSLYEVALEFGIKNYVKLGKGEENSGGRDRPSLLADAVEALLGAIYLDGGMEAALSFAMKFIPNRAKLAIKGKSFMDYKTMLQEIVQKNHEEILSYRLKSESGPDHDKRFVAEVLLNSNAIAQGQGKSKKEAEQMAAKEALKLMGQ